MRKEGLSNVIQDYLKLRVLRIHEPNSGYRNKSFRIDLENGKTINFILLKKEQEILSRVRNANWIGDYLASKGFPARKTYVDYHNRLITPLIALKSKTDSVIAYACIYEYLNGNTIPWEAYTSKHIKNLGGRMGEMHRFTAKIDYSKLNLPLECDIQFLNIKKMEKYFQDGNVFHAILEKLNLKLNFDIKKFNNLFRIISNEPIQVLHMDFVRGNILFDNDANISGVLDFEKVALGPRIIEIARTLAFLIIDCKYISESKIRKYFLFNGYKKRGQNNLPNLEYLNLLIAYFLIYDFYKFLKHNPYESLQFNEHYLRTSEYLLKLKLVDLAD